MEWCVYTFRSNVQQTFFITWFQCSTRFTMWKSTTDFFSFSSSGIYGIHWDGIMIGNFFPFCLFELKKMCILQIELFCIIVNRTSVFFCCGTPKVFFSLNLYVTKSKNFFCFTEVKFLQHCRYFSWLKCLWFLFHRHHVATAVYQVTRPGHEHCDATEGILLDITPLVVDGKKLVTLYDKDLTEGVNLLIGTYFTVSVLQYLNYNLSFSLPCECRS